MLVRERRKSQVPQRLSHRGAAHRGRGIQGDGSPSAEATGFQAGVAG